MRSGCRSSVVPMRGGRHDAVECDKGSRRRGSVTFCRRLSSYPVGCRCRFDDRLPCEKETEMPTEQQIKDAWIDHRPYLVDMAFRMLGDIGRAEDVVQEAFQRLSRSDFDAIEDARGWLIVVTSRLCLDVIRSARSRHERTVSGPDMAERFEGAEVGASGGSGGSDPADRVTLDDGVRLALLVVLERLSAAERVAFVLHDIFGVPFDAVAETVGRPEATCRQLARRARLKLEAPDGGRRTAVTSDEHRLVTDRFISACANGNFDDLLAVLDPD